MQVTHSDSTSTIIPLRHTMNMEHIAWFQAGSALNLSRSDILFKLEYFVPTERVPKEYRGYRQNIVCSRIGAYQLGHNIRVFYNSIIRGINSLKLLPHLRIHNIHRRLHAGAGDFYTGLRGAFHFLAHGFYLIGFELREDIAHLVALPEICANAASQTRKIICCEFVYDGGKPVVSAIGAAHTQS